MDLRDQVRRLPHARAHRCGRGRAAHHAQRPRLEQPHAAPGAGAGRHEAQARLARRRDRGARRIRPDRLPVAAERLREHADARHRVLPVRRALLRRPRPARRAAGRAARVPAHAARQGAGRHPLQRGLRCTAEGHRRIGLRARARRRHRQAQEQRLRLAPLGRLDQAQVQPAAGVRHRRLHRSERLAHRHRRALARRARRQGRAAVRRQGRHRLQRPLARRHAQAAAKDRHRPAPLQEPHRRRTQRALGQAHPGGGGDVFGMDDRRPHSPRRVSRTSSPPTPGRPSCTSCRRSSRSATPSA